MSLAAGQIDNVMKEERLFPPPADFAAKARIGSMEEYEKLYRQAADDLEGFWGNLACELHWFEPFQKVLQWDEPLAKWFVGGKTNASYNCLDVHLQNHRRDKAGPHLGRRAGRYPRAHLPELHEEVCRFANVLKQLGVGRGDVVSIYMPLVPELAIAMLACARIGAIHCVIFGGFSAEAIAERNNNSAAKVVLTADGGWRRGKQLPLKENVDLALQKSPTVQKCVVLRRTGQAGDDDARPRLLVARTDRSGRRRLPRRTAGQRNAAFHPLYQRLDGQAQGHHAYDRRLQPLRQEDDRMGLRRPRRGHLLVYGRHGLDHRAIPTSSTGRSPPGRRSSFTKAPRTRPTAAAGGG